MRLTKARDAKGFTARKPDGSEAEWLADLLRQGLRKPSFLPPRPRGEWRALTRYRESLVREQTALAHRLQQLIASANRKRGQVTSAARGGSGQRRLRAVAAGETEAEKLSHLARRTLKRKQPQLQPALAGRVTHAPRWVRGQVLDPYDQRAAALTRAAARLPPEGESSPDPCVPEALKRLETSPGVAETVAPTLVAESGVARGRFPPDHPLASGAGRWPGNNASAGTRQSGQTPTGSRSVRAALGQAAGAASHQQGPSRAAPYTRLVNRRGKQQAVVAVGQSILRSVYQVLPTRTSSQDLGGDDCARRTVDKQRTRLIRQLESLGVKVTVEEIKEAA